MAIQFQCPSCDAVIRVPDTAAGKKGTCPRCNEKLLVPQPAGSLPGTAATAATATAATATTTAAPQPDAQPLPPVSGAPALPRLDELSPVSLPDVTAPAPQTAPETAPAVIPGLAPLEINTAAGRSASRGRTARRNSVSWTQFIAPLLCLAVIGGFIAWYLQSSQPRLEGKLTATVTFAPDIPGIPLPAEDSQLSPDELEQINERFESNPLTWVSTISKYVIFGSDEGLKVTLRNGTAAHFVQIAPRQHPALVQYIKEHESELDKARQQSIRDHAPELFTAWKAQVTSGKPIKDQKRFRDQVLLPAMVTGFGYHLHAIVAGNSYPCVWVDDEGTLYFLVPNATRSFQLQGKEINGKVAIPANFDVLLSKETDRSRKSSKRRASPDSEPESDEENPGMNPDAQPSAKQKSAPKTKSTSEDAEDNPPGRMNLRRSAGMSNMDNGGNGMSASMVDGMSGGMGGGMEGDSISEGSMSEGSMTDSMTEGAMSGGKQPIRKPNQKPSAMMENESMEGSMMNDGMDGMDGEMTPKPSGNRKSTTFKSSD